MGIADAKADWWNVIIELDNGIKISVDLLDRELKIHVPAWRHNISLYPSYGGAFADVFNAVKELAMAEDYPMLAFLRLMTFTSMDYRYYNFLQKVIRVYKQQNKVLADYRPYYVSTYKPERREWDTVSNINRAFSNITKQNLAKSIVDYVPYLQQLPAEWMVKETINKWANRIIAASL